MANKDLKKKNVVTDVLVGCNMLRLFGEWWCQGWSMGKIADMHMFDRILTQKEMIGMTTCQGDKIEGNVFNSNTDPFTVYGLHVDIIKIQGIFV